MVCPPLEGRGDRRKTVGEVYFRDVDVIFSKDARWCKTWLFRIVLPQDLFWEH